MEGCNCLDCGKELSKKIYKRCRSCNQKGELNHNWNGGLPVCKNCGNRCKFSMSKYCIKCFQLGDRNPQWNGGTTSLRNSIRNQDRYKIWRKEVFLRDMYRCQRCWIKKPDLEAHHIIPLSTIIKNNRISNLLEAMECIELWDTLTGETVCVDCHNKINHRKLMREYVRNPQR